MTNTAGSTPIEDGACSLYSSAPLKVMHLLKQPTQNKPPSIPNLVDEVAANVAANGELGSVFMRRVAERSYALLKNCTYKDVHGATDADLCYALQSVAIVNLCHNQLARNTPQRNLLTWATCNKSRWHGKITQCKPRLIVCGGTFDAVWEALNKPACLVTSTGMTYFHDLEVDFHCTYMKMPHPVAHCLVTMAITFLIVGAKEILP